MSRLAGGASSDMESGPPEDRVLALTPTGRDAPLAAGFLARAGIRTQICPDIGALCRELDVPSGAVLIAEEALTADALQLFRRALARQAAWSDVPVLLLTGRMAAGARGAKLAEAIGNATVIQRPTRALILIQAVQKALRMRRRQHQLRDHLLDCETRERSARTAVRLERTLRAQASAAREESEERYRRLAAESAPDDTGAGAADAAALQAQLRRQAEQLARMDQRKNEFIAMLARELHNPLAPIHNAVHVLKIQPDPPEARHVHWALDVIGRQTQHLTRLVDDLLDIAGITRGRIELRNQTVDLGAALAQAADAARLTFDGRRQRFEFTPPATPLRVQADPARLAQIIGALLNNAARHTPPGGNISLAARAEDGRAVITVRDDGLGIAPDALPGIFDLFNQAAPAVGDTGSGLGLGLALVHRLVQLHGGRVTAHSAGPGRGSEFNVYLPLADGRAAARPPQRAVVRGTGARILVVDDNSDVARSLAILLGTMGHTVRTAADGPAALQAMKEFRPNVAFIDIGLPGMDGYELAKRLRVDYPREALRLVALTGYGQADARARTVAAGFDAHILKPGDVATLEALAQERPEKPGSP